MLFLSNLQGKINLTLDAIFCKLNFIIIKNMTIKRLSNTEIIIENEDCEITVDFTKKDSLRALFKNTDLQAEITKPGEYGYLQALIEAYESTIDIAKAKVDFLVVDVGGVRVLFVFGEGNLTKEDLAKLANIHIIVFNLEDNSKAKSLENELEAKIMILVKTSEEDTEKLKKELGISDLNLNSKYSYSSKDFDSEVETPVRYVVLGK